IDPTGSSSFPAESEHMLAKVSIDSLRYSAVRRIDPLQPQLMQKHRLNGFDIFQALFRSPGSHQICFDVDLSRQQRSRLSVAFDNELFEEQRTAKIGKFVIQSGFSVDAAEVFHIRFREWPHDHFRPS